MNTFIFNQNYIEPALSKQSESILSRFIYWTKNQEKNRIAWLGISVTLMTAIFFPVTMASILLHGASFKLIIASMASLIIVVVPNLAALPTRYTIPAFLIGILIDITLIGLSFFI
jgi:hypothetical protein